MAESRVIVNRPNSSSPPPNCAICLGACINKCFSDSCMHQFCFKCLLKWSKIKAECPLCKQPLRRIIHNVKSNEEYDEHVVDVAPPEEIHIIDNEEFLVLPLGPTSHARHQFHFRTTFTVDTRGEHAIQQMLLTHPLTNGGQISIEGYAPSRNMYHRRRRENNTTTSYRRSIYTRNLWVSAPPDVTNRYRDVSPSFFRSCPGARTRLVPWLNRELNALLYENTQLVMRLVDIIMDHLLRHHICSRTFRNLLYQYLDNKTDHFVHEFYNFMRSPFDMIGYDANIIYTERPRSPAPYIDVSDNDNDSDVIIVGTTNQEEPVVIDLVNTDSDEPILVSQEEPQLPLPIPAERYTEPERRTPILPLKLRLKHKRLSREKEKEKKRQKRKLHRHRSGSSSSSFKISSSSSEDEYSKSSYERYKRRKRQRKLSKRRPSFSTESDLNIDTNSEGDDNLPLSAFTNKKKSLKKHKSHTRSSKDPKHNSYPTVSYSAKDYLKRDVRIPLLDLPNSEMPSCSKYSSDSSATHLSQRSKLSKASTSREETKKKTEANTNNNINEDSSGSMNVPTCSKYTFSPYTMSREGSNTSPLNLIKSDGETSNDEDYPLTHLVRSEVREVRPEEKSGGPSGSNNVSGNGRLKNILLKKEESSNTWYPYHPCNYDTDSSEN
ncbi:hypothetical protein NQ315_009405 [Exocentrus adspersus]|uniref:E3 ubiquitin-protein ligase Topors n=1 Tax=Exocentrus adspersus TaxID=1586481 RepID=A0AAV8WHG6_9CUCU|nr:hypothetical protein NQ315_009405 [Exocentrus adspersus]